ncbi:nicotinate-nucleotide--dimethylbenzimidazole phosphoribosyltransferase [Hyphomicrobium sp.]|uniref:nicotinate-nucleotide--dimethylbenzimidazole phosphoribosyltransferase n=1 Tax=Hyphomicrobium sp. TaxID=82 RepID=UPI000FAD3772|nr:nicotinate-nucleotide--dimethylbenzimidazole phosphoribosyltransferase [Hyphomicrobium sp.]RUP08140.1 MAG: nicotinate-nucleotide--dimethylbenzimidazole phosphoribosyltransferase [Hyphomicrobium sp.]
MTVKAGAKQSQTLLADELRARLRGKAKPVGSLGRLEDLAVQIGLIAGTTHPDLGVAKILVFAGDHGLTAEGVTAYPSVVTREIAKFVLAGTAGVNVLARAAGVGVELVDTGMLEPLPSHDRLLDRRIANGTRNARREPAMSAEECEAALEAGRALDAHLGAENAGIVGFGEIGIGNTSSAALIAHSLTGLDLKSLVGPGAGAPALGLDHKYQVLSETVARAAIEPSTSAERTFEVLRQFGGFEIVMMAGAMTAAAASGRVIVVDGFISTAGAIAAEALNPGTIDNCIFAHCSAEPGHAALLKHLSVRPLLELEMRLGEGTGSALAIPIIRAAELLLREMADLPGEHPV